MVNVLTPTPMPKIPKLPGATQRRYAELRPFVLQEGPDASSDVRSHITTALSGGVENCETPPLVRFKADYERWPTKDKATATWEEVQKRLLANNGHYLNLASAMNEGGLLFGIDTEGNPLVADGGLRPIMCGMNYFDTREAVRFTQNGEGEKTPTGYEMFGFNRENQKSHEVLAFEAFTAQPFVRSSYEQEAASWLESGDLDPSVGWTWSARGIYMAKDDLEANVRVVPPTVFYPFLGVRRLLRVKA